VHGSSEAKDNRVPRFSRVNAIEIPEFDFGRISLPPATYAQEKHKVEVRWPAAQKFIRENQLNEIFDGTDSKLSAELGIVCLGGMYNVTIRALQLLGLASAFGESRIPIYALNVAYPLIPEEVSAFCAGKRAVLMIEEGQPAYIEDALHAILRRADLQTKVQGKDVLPMAGEYTGEVVLTGVAKWIQAMAPHIREAGYDPSSATQTIESLGAVKKRAAELLGAPVPGRPPGFCVGCPERPVFSAMKLLERESGAFHVSADIGCHTFSTLPPFNIGNTVLGYGLGLASNSGIAPMFDRRTVTIMGDGGFWHNGLTSGIANAVFNRSDGILVIMKNGYTSANGTQNIPSSLHQTEWKSGDMSIERALKGIGVEWVKSVYTYRVDRMAKTLRDAMTSAYTGLKVIIADAECQLERQRRLRPQVAAKLKAGERVVRTRFGVDEDVCSGDHSCIRLSGCPSLTVKTSSDPLKVDPVAHVNNACVGCGLCGEVAHAAILCPSFFRAEIVQNPTLWDRLLAGLRNTLIGWLQPPEGARQ
jgi:indolepyruvate ferredoxin oxidoreductase, alpha subunit